jgi:hypothetical protein
MAEPAVLPQAPASVATAEPPVADGTQAPMPEQGDLLGQASAHPAATPGEEVAGASEPAPVEDEHPPKDAAQG